MKEKDRGEKKMNDSEETEEIKTFSLYPYLCCLTEKGRRKREEIVEEMKERDRGEKKINDSEETEEIKKFSLYHYLLQAAGLAQL